MKAPWHRAALSPQTDPLPRAGIPRGQGCSGDEADVPGQALIHVSAMAPCTAAFGGPELRTLGVDVEAGSPLGMVEAGCRDTQIARQRASALLEAAASPSNRTGKRTRPAETRGTWPDRAVGVSS